MYSSPSRMHMSRLLILLFTSMLVSGLSITTLKCPPRSSHHSPFYTFDTLRLAASTTCIHLPLVARTHSMLHVRWCLSYVTERPHTTVRGFGIEFLYVYFLIPSGCRAFRPRANCFNAMQCRLLVCLSEPRVRCEGEIEAGKVPVFTGGQHSTYAECRRCK